MSPFLNNAPVRKMTIADGAIRFVTHFEATSALDTVFGRRVCNARLIYVLRKLKVRVLVQLPEAGGVTFDTRIGPVEGPAHIFCPMIERLRSKEVVTFAEMEDVPPFAGMPGLINQVFHSLVGSGAVHPVPETDVESNAARRLNAILLDRHRHGQPVPALASHSFGSGISVNPDELDALAGGKPVHGILSPLREIAMSLRQA